MRLFISISVYLRFAVEKPHGRREEINYPKKGTQDNSYRTKWDRIS